MTLNLSQSELVQPQKPLLSVPVAYGPGSAFRAVRQFNRMRFLLTVDYGRPVSHYALYAIIADRLACPDGFVLKVGSRVVDNPELAEPSRRTFMRLQHVRDPISAGKLHRHTLLFIDVGVKLLEHDRGHAR